MEYVHNSCPLSYVISFHWQYKYTMFSIKLHNRVTDVTRSQHVVKLLRMLWCNLIWLIYWQSSLNNPCILVTPAPTATITPAPTPAPHEILLWNITNLLKIYLKLNIVPHEREEESTCTLQHYSNAIYLTTLLEKYDGLNIFCIPKLDVPIAR